MHRRGFFLTLISSLAAAAGCQRGRQPDKTGNAAVDAILGQHGPGLDVSLWVGGADGAPKFEWNSGVPRSTASSIKAFYLVELFATHADALDKPLPGIGEILKDDMHPAMAVFKEPAARDAIRRVLTGASVRRIGEVMIQGLEDEKQPHENAVYNAAANLTTAALGGPEALTQLIRKRDPAFDKVSVRRYMLADRTKGENEAPATAFAALYGKLASLKLASLAGKTLTEVLKILLRDQDEKLGLLFGKGGDLDTDPQVCVREGCWRGGKETIVYVAMLVQSNRGREDRDAAYERLKQTAKELETALVDIGKAPAK